MKHYSVKEFDKLLRDKLTSEYGVSLEVASNQQIYRALALISRQMMSNQHKKFLSKVLANGEKQVYYLCMEFLMGRSLKTSLFSLGLNEVAQQALAKADIKLETIYEEEPDAGLGNGGLGRLAACYLDGMATTGIAGTGYSILYEYGIFKQKIVDGWQQERADNWLPGGQVWLKSHPDQAVEVRFDGQIQETWDGDFHHVSHVNYNSVLAVPSDMYVQGYDGDGVAKLRLWQAKAPDFDMSSFNAGDYGSSITKNASAELISKILYPNDNHVEGKILRLRQQYFLSAASIGDIIQKHLDVYGTLENLPEKVAIQLNDTHPTLAIPELMRILLDECGYTWEKAFDICRRTFAYTNHTVMSEALEKWNIDIFKMTLPRIFTIVQELDRRCREDLFQAFPGDVGKVDYMAILGDNQVRMANICCYVCHSINGVSKLHSQIIKDSVFHDYYLYKPAAFKNVTNGIAYRRWLLASNPGLTGLLDDLIGDGFKHDASQLSKLAAYKDDASVLKRLDEVKRQNKAAFASYLEKTTGQVINPDSIFDCQVKRMHEYKRQHLNALNIAAQYLYLKENPNAEFTPKTYIFGAKAAPGYYMAKQMIRLICKLGALIDADPAMRDKLRVVYLEDYCVSLSERLMPASEVSEQISLAGTEASGTGNMKFMLSGAITLGTLDGANVEIADAAGHENEFIFGMLTPEVNRLKAMGYHPSMFINNDDVAMQVLSFLERGFNGDDFHEVVNNLRSSDPYMVMADFKAYREAQAKMQAAYTDRTRWNQMSLANIAASGIFSADRSVMDYARDIWDAHPVR
ncbi:MAG: glycogen/starch/alpha-glucan phosphorylase [Oscillospiraceae bacterium]|nr:glycogen/starch/alpha-glucan phosphorylase [Bacteroidales bacterium]MDD6999379.1 glycogen/starch/alpha-glucan phosphorylase [Oscillospiraceae bacterium]MDY5094742.1 glycogen/starch/alpha-glucan phosphorylase [Oscillospiraceae bacterium]